MAATMERNGTITEARIRRLIQQELEGAEVETTLADADYQALVHKVSAHIRPDLDGIQDIVKRLSQPIDLERLAGEVGRFLKPIVKRIEVKAPDGKVRKIEGKTHAAFEKVLKLASRRKNVLLVGPSGCGKTHLAEQVAKALSLPFSCVSVSGGMS